MSRSAESTLWDAIVVGAGPAGSTIARLLSLAGARTLLVDRSRFPRDKVCGCCVNPRAAQALEDTGAGRVLASLSANPIRSLRVRTRTAEATFALPPTRCVSRAALDSALLDLAVQAGVEVRTGIAARIGACEGDTRTVSLDSDESMTVQARIVICAAGLRAGGTLPPDMPPARIARHSRVGLSAIVEHIPGLLRNELRMTCAPHGYIGMATLEDGRVDVAAAVAPSFIRSAGGPGAAIELLLHQSGAPAGDALAGAQWSGTPPLTHTRCPAAERLLLIGDAAQYVEPFTGEGIAWALQTAQAAAPIALKAIEDWSPSLSKNWVYTHKKLLCTSRRRCRAIATLARHPAAVGALLRLHNAAGRASTPLVRAIAGDLLAATP